MTWCKHCKRNQATYTAESNSSVCCEECGRVLTQEIYSDDVQYIKGSDGQSQAQGSFKSFKKALSGSLERSLNNGVPTTIEYHKLILEVEDFKNGNVDASFIPKHEQELAEPVNMVAAKQ